MTGASRRSVLVFALACVLLAPIAATAAEPPRITGPSHATKGDVTPSRMYSAPALAIDPANPLRVVGSFVEMRSRRCGLLRSADGGRTWRAVEASPSLPSYPFCFANTRGAFHAPVAFGRAGALYYALPGWDTQDGGLGGNVSVLLARSTNLGDSWRTTIAYNARGKQGEAQESNRPISGMAIDRRTGDDDAVYLVWGRRFPGTRAPNASPTQPVAAVSTDGGRTFAAPVNLAERVFEPEDVRREALRSTTTVPGSTTSTTAPPPGSRAALPLLTANFGGFGPSVAVADDGTAYAVWPSTTANISPRPSAGHFLSTSTDRGRTWTTRQIAPFSATNGTFLRLAWSPKGGAQGTLHLVTDGTDRPEVSGLGDVYYRRSTDGGRTWSARRNLTDDDPVQLFGQFYPNVSVAPNGRVDVVWWDTRDDPGIRANDVYYASSTDNGATWSENRRVTDRSIDRRIGVWANNFDVNSPPSLASSSPYALVGWDDTRLTDPGFADNLSLGGGVQDIFTAAVQHSAVGAGSDVARIALAAVVGLTAVGLMLLLSATVIRRRAGPPPPPAPVEPRTEVPTAVGG